MTFKVKIKSDALELLFSALGRVGTGKFGIDNKTARKVGKTTIDMMKKRIANGLSPIRGKGRFPKYKASYQKQIRGGGSRFRGKKIRPVNLLLSGKFLRGLQSKIISDGTGQKIPEISYKGAQADKEDGHRTGANNQEKRPTIPINRERYMRDIEKAQEKEYAKRIDQVIQRINEKFK